MRTIAARVGVAGLVMTDDGIEPIAGIEGAIRAHGDVHRTEGFAAGDDGADDPLGLEAGAVVDEAMQVERVAVIPADETGALEFRRHGLGAEDVDGVGFQRGVEQRMRTRVFVRRLDGAQAR